MLAGVESRHFGSVQFAGLRFGAPASLFKAVTSWPRYQSIAQGELRPAGHVHFPWAPTNGAMNMNSNNAMKTNTGRHLCVDGHEFRDIESNWAGDGQFAPFAVFDIDAQENLLPYYATRKEAEVAMAAMLKEPRNLETVQETIVEYGVNEIVPGGAGHNPFDANFETQEKAEQEGPDYLIANPEVPGIVVFRLTIVDNTITEDQTLLRIDRSQLASELVVEAQRA